MTTKLTAGVSSRDVIETVLGEVENDLYSTSDRDERAVLQIARAILLFSRLFTQDDDK